MISLSHFKILFQMLFLVRVTSTEYNWVTLAEGRQSEPRVAIPLPGLARGLSQVANKWLADIHEICVSSSIDWWQVRENAERFELNSVEGPTLTACSSLFGTPTPPGFSAAAIPAGVQLFPGSLAPSEAWKAPLFYSRLLKRPSEKLRWLVEMFFVARLADRRFLPLPPSLSFLYYTLRPLRLSCNWLWLCAQAG